MNIDDPSTISGYYRYTDVRFQYPQAIFNSKDASALRAAMHHTALGNPNHPLWVDKEKGLELFIGTLPNGQQHLFFSSAQIEYMRYFLHATGLAKTLLPLPSSQSLFMASALTDVSSISLKTPDEVKKAYSNVTKNSKRIRKDALLMSYQRKFDKVRELYSSKKGAWLAIDIEAWTVTRSAITEFGWSYVLWDDDEREVEGHGHFIVKKNKHLRNGQYVADAQDKFGFGTSEELETAEFKKAVRELISNLQGEFGLLFPVFHDCRQDIEFLKNTEYFGDGLTDNFEFTLPNGTLDKIPGDGKGTSTFIIDTTELFGALEGDAQGKRSLGDMCRLLNIKTQYLHNAGNDAYYTLQALKTMASGNQVDVQREERWSSQGLTSRETARSLGSKIGCSTEDEEDFDLSLAEEDE